MKSALRAIAAGGLLGAAAAGACAQDTAAGLWKSIDDATGREKSLVRITADGGVYTGRIESLLEPRPAATVCEKCTDDRKGQPLIGLAIIRNAKAAEEPGVYTGGDITDPNNGKTYKLRMQLLDGGRRLQVRGYIGPFFRSQVWQRAE